MAKPKVLIVEDDQSLLSIYSTMLKQGGYEPLLAANAKTAIDIVKNQEPQLIIEDLSLPDLSGVQLVHCIRQIPEGKNIPVIILSGSQGRIESARQSQEHFVAFLQKPVDMETLLSTVKTFIT